MVFNSVGQYLHFKKKLKSEYPDVSCGLRVNPGFSKVEVDMYNPTAPGSRLGIDADQLIHELPEGIDGIHFHALCESSSYDLEETLAVFEQKFGQFTSSCQMGRHGWWTCSDAQRIRYGPFNQDSKEFQRKI